MARRIRKPKSGKLIRKVSSQKKKRTVSKKRAVSAHKRLRLASSSDIFSSHIPSRAFHPHWSEQWLPRSYNVTKLVLMVRDPEWIFAYWDLETEKKQWVERLFSEGHARTVLRIYDVTDVEFDLSHVKTFWDVEVDLGTLEWYVHVQSFDRTLVADLAIIDRFGRFHVIARSNTIRMPRLGPSDIIDEQWMCVDFDEIYALSGGFRIGGASEQLSSFNWSTSFSPGATSFVSIKKKKLPPTHLKKKRV